VTSPGSRPPVVIVAGLGNEFRHDDGVGPVVAARCAGTVASVREVGPLGDPLDLLGQWDGADLAVVVDAVRSGAPAGTVSVLELTGGGDGGGHREGPRDATSTHGIGLARVVRLARILGQAPARVAVVGIEGLDFGRGRGLSPAVAAAVGAAVDRVVALIEEVGTCA